jgi:hypothetical protein
MPIAYPRCLFLAGLALLGLSPLTARIWTDSQGRTLEAELVSVTPTAVNVRRADGRSLSLARAQLSAADQAFVDAAAAATPQATGTTADRVNAPATASAPGGGDFNEFNRLLGLPVLADGLLWDDEPAAVARQLKLTVEGKNAHFEGYRGYPHPPQSVLGSEALMIALQAAEGRVTSLVLQFANRGDFPGFKRCAADGSQPTAGELKAFEQALKSDFTALSAGLTAKLGEPKRERALFGGLDSGRLLLRWEWHGHALLLSQEQGQMVMLKIVPGGKATSAKLGDDQVRRLFKERVARRAGGDVVLDQIPMVDQGPKGYCVPATFERYLRYAGISADMYELAACGGNSYGGGTSFQDMARGLAHYVSRHGRGLEKKEFELNVQSVARYIDEGRPIIWGLCSTQDYNHLANTNSAERKKAADLGKWKPTPTAKEIEGLYPASESAHACLIIGYNRATKEIAVSDSWGPRFQERWIPAAAAQKVSQGEYWVLAW